MTTFQGAHSKHCEVEVSSARPPSTGSEMLNVGLVGVAWQVFILSDGTRSVTEPKSAVMGARLVS